MNQDISKNTILKTGDWVIKKDTGTLYKIVETAKKDVYEVRQDGKNFAITSGVTFVADKSELIKNYQKVIE